MKTAEFAYLCGCDGAHSKVREGLKLGFPGGTYAHHYYVADVRIADDASTDVYMNLGEDAFALRLPVRSSGMTRLIGIMPDAADKIATPTFEDVRAEAEPLLGVNGRGGQLVLNLSCPSSRRGKVQGRALFYCRRCWSSPQPDRRPGHEYRYW